MTGAEDALSPYVSIVSISHAEMLGKGGGGGKLREHGQSSCSLLPIINFRPFRIRASKACHPYQIILISEYALATLKGL